MDLGTFDIKSKSGNNYILILVDIFSRFTILRAIPDKTATTIANELADVFCLFGFPKVIQSDNGSEFKNELVAAMLQCTGIDHRLSLPYNPLGNNVAESYIGIAKKTIIKKLQGVANEWDFHVRGAQYAMNCKYARVHSSRPFAVMFNRQPNEFKCYSDVQLGDSSDLSADVQKLEEKIGHMNDVVIPSLRKRMEERRQVDHEKFNKRNRIIKQNFPLDSKVMILNVKKRGKVDPIYEGPFYVHGVTKNGSYTLRDPANALLTRDVPTHHIKLISSDEVTASEDVTHKMVAIVEHDGQPGNYTYRVRWKGYTEEDDTWETADSFDDKNIIDIYWQRRNANEAQI